LIPCSVLAKRIVVVVVIVDVVRAMSFVGDVDCAMYPVEYRLYQASI
jgi:hypothetical protein